MHSYEMRILDYVGVSTISKRWRPLDVRKESLPFILIRT